MFSPFWVRHRLGLTLAALLHAALLGAWWSQGFASHDRRPIKPDDVPITLVVITPEPVRPPQAAPAPPKPLPRPMQPPKPLPAPVPVPDHAPAFHEAPPAPTAEEWQLAATYTLKNSKRYRNTWAQQVRSMMGTAYEGADQGAVRFHIEIAPNGQLVKLEKIWSTSDKAEKLAREALAKMPPLPPTPTGRPLIFQKTISFQPFDNGWPPIYKYDCLPDPQGFKNPWAWDGKSDRKPPDDTPREVLTHEEKAQRLKECPEVPEDTVDAHAGDMKRQFEQWGGSQFD